MSFMVNAAEKVNYLQWTQPTARSRGCWGGRLESKFGSERGGRAPQWQFKAIGRVSSQALQGSSCHWVIELSLNRSSSPPS